jgi:gliding motility-associated lipoprotein GldD
MRAICILSVLFFMVSCRPKVYPPKPPGYYRLDTPAQHEYRLFDRPGFPYTFEYPVYANLEADTMFVHDTIDTRYWININFPSLDAIINITYKQITPKEPINKLISDAFEMSYFHQKRADYIQPYFFTNPTGTSGIMYVLGGNTASKYQFTGTDSTKNFIRGALYFNTTPNADSLKPASDFIARDIEHLLWTLKWKSK